MVEDVVVVEVAAVEVVVALPTAAFECALLAQAFCCLFATPAKRSPAFQTQTAVTELSQ